MSQRKLLRLSGREAASTDDAMARFIVGAPPSARVVRKKTGYRDFTTGEDVDLVLTWDGEHSANASGAAVNDAPRERVA